MAMRIWGVWITVLAIWIWGLPLLATALEQSDRLDVEISSEGVGIVHANLILAAKRELIRRLLMDYPNWPKLFPRTPTIHYIKELEGSVRVGMTVPAFFLPMTLRLVTETQEPQPFRIVTRMVEGDFDRYDWVWELTPTRDGRHTHATLTLNVKPQFYTPDWALVWILKTDLKEHFDRLRQQLILKDPRQSAEPPHDGLP